MESGIRVTVWNEGVHEKKSEEVRRIYPHGMGWQIAQYLKKQAIDPESFRGWMVRAGGKLGIGPQFALPKGEQAALGAAAENIEGAVLGSGRTLGGMLSTIRETLEGKASQFAGTYYARSAGTPGTKQGLSDWANYLVNRVGYLAEETSGKIAANRASERCLFRNKASFTPLR